MIQPPPIRILLISVRADFGGGPEHIYRLLNSLHEKVEFYVACPEDYPYYEMYSKLLGADRLTKIPHRKFSPAALWELASFCKKNRIKIVHSHGKGAGLYSRMLTFFWSLKSIHTFHGIHIGEYSFFKKFLYITLEGILSFFTSRFISVSHGEMEQVTEAGFAAPEKVTLIANGTPIPEKTASYSFKGTAVPEIVTISRFDYAKNTELLIPIAENLVKSSVSFLFTIIGSGEGMENMKKYISAKNLDNHFRFPGAVLNTGDYLINSFCYISTSRWEGLPLGVLEAMSYSLPVIATNVTGNSDLVESNINGWLYETDKPADAAEHIIKLLNDENSYRMFAINSRKKVIDNYSLAGMAEKTLNLYTEIK
jgi:glycosyltransferase involved in cell wall biosynthesis